MLTSSKMAKNWSYIWDFLRALFWNASFPLRPCPMLSNHVPQGFTWVTKPSNRVIHTKMILVQCVIPLRNICILKFIACREWQLAQRDGFKGGIFHTVTSTLQWYSASGTFLIQFSSYKQNKQKPRTPSRSRFSSFTHLLNKYPLTEKKIFCFR